MARIPDSEIERIKKNTSLVTVLEQQGFELKKHGKDYATCCPFHDDKTPSLIITPTTNLYHCFGCGAAGSVIDWMMQIEKVGFRSAVDLLLKRAQVSTSVKSLPREPVSQEIDIPEAETQALLHQSLSYYHTCLLTNEPALAYLDKRGLNHPELIETFKLGFSDRKLGQILASKTSQEGKTQREVLKQKGVLLENGIERFVGSIVVPVINNAQVLEIYGRKIGDRLRKGTAIHGYLPGKHAGIWNVEGLLHQSEIILCESLIDAMTLWVHGFKNVTASYGVHGFTDELHQFLKTQKIQTVLIAYDSDEAGNKAAYELIEKLNQDKINTVRLSIPLNIDVNEWALIGCEFVSEFTDCLLKAKASGLSFLAASCDPVKTETPTTLDVQRNGNDLHITLGQREYRVRGLEKNKNREQLKINLMLRFRDSFFVDALDLYHAKQRAQFIKQAGEDCSIEENIVKGDLGKLLLTLENWQEENSQNQTGDNTVKLTEAETNEALGLLNDPHLLARIVSDFNDCGVVGEDTNTLVGYLASVSRKLDKPLAVIIQSTSAAGKSTLMDAVLNLMPEEERVQYSAMTGQSLYYLGEKDLKHKILAIAEEEGASNASYALKLLQSEGEITIASTGKDEASGDLTTKEYTVEGPVMLFLTTTAIDIDEELMNRCLVLTVNESQEQTEAIHACQRFADTLEGLLAKESKKQTLNRHHNAQRLLKSLAVVNPFAEQLSFLSHKTRTRRDHQKYLTLIKSIALLHQYQRDIKNVKQGDEVIQYIEVEQKDIEIANELASDVLGRTLDELPPQTRKLLQLIYQYAKKNSESEKLEIKDFRFSRRELREFTGWGLTQIATHCQRLEAMEYLIIHSGQRGQLMRYELSYDGQGDQGQNFMLGLSQKPHLDVELSGLKPTLSGSNRPQIGGVSGPNRGKENGVKPSNGVASDLFNVDHLRKNINQVEKNTVKLHPGV